MWDNCILLLLHYLILGVNFSSIPAPRADLFQNSNTLWSYRWFPLATAISKITNMFDTHTHTNKKKKNIYWRNLIQNVFSYGNDILDTLLGCTGQFYIIKWHSQKSIVACCSENYSSCSIDTIPLQMYVTHQEIQNRAIQFYQYSCRT